MNFFKNVYLFFALSLLFVFAGCSLVVLQFQINSYKSIYDSSNQQAQMYTPIAYVQNKVRNYDKTHGLSVESVDGVSSLVLHDEKMDTYLYCYGGKLMELAVVPSYELDLSMGTALFDCDEFEVTNKENVLSMVIDGHLITQTIHAKEAFYVKK